MVSCWFDKLAAEENFSLSMLGNYYYNHLQHQQSLSLLCLLAVLPNECLLKGERKNVGLCSHA